MKDLKVGDRILIVNNYGSYNGREGVIREIRGVPARTIYLVDIGGSMILVNSIFAEKVEDEKKKPRKRKEATSE